MELNTYELTKSVSFQMYLLSSPLVKKINKEFSFYNVYFYRKEKSKVPTVCLNYPKGNAYWFIDFKKFINNEILAKDGSYQREWDELLYNIRQKIHLEMESLNNQLKLTSAKEVLLDMTRYNLRMYQAFDLEQLLIKMKNNTPNAGLILSEQRTGKTRIALAACLKLMPISSKIVIICPKSSISGWVDEANILNEHISIAPFIVHPILKSKDVKDVKLYVSKLNVEILSYDTFKKLTLSQIRTLISISDTEDVMIIGDEVHRLRNFTTQQSDALFNLKKYILPKMNVRLLGVTGTPAVKESYDVFGVLSFINTSRIGFQPYYKDFNEFKEYFYNCEDTSFGKKCKSLRRVNEMNYILQEVSVQTKQHDLDLFKNYTKKYLKYNLNLDEYQKDIYKSVKDTMEFGDEIDCKNKLVQLVRLQQICIDPSGLVASYEGVAPKLNWVLTFAKKNSFQFIVMAKKIKPLDNLYELLQSNGIPCGYLKGSLSLPERQDRIKLFKDSKFQVLLIQLDVGKESLTLPEAKCTIFLDRDFAQGFNEQAEARMTPIDGSTCTKYIIDLVMNDTIEEAIYNTLVVKKESIDDANTVFRKEEK